MKKTFFITILLSSLLLAGCGTESTTEKNGSPSENSPEKTETSRKSDTRKSELKECLAGCEVFQEGEGLLSKGMCTDTCWSEEATIKKDISICDDKVSADNVLIQIGCRMDVAEETLDEKYCATIDDEMMQSGCYTEIAGLKKDSSICENITIGISKALCIDDIENGDGVYEEYTDEVEDYYDEGGY